MGVPHPAQGRQGRWWWLGCIVCLSVPCAPRAVLCCAAPLRCMAEFVQIWGGGVGRGRGIGTVWRLRGEGGRREVDEGVGICMDGFGGSGRLHGALGDRGH